MNVNFRKLCIDSVNVIDQRVLIRSDLNVPLARGEIVNNQRIITAVVTIKYVLENGAKSVIIVSHLGRPDGRKIERYSLAHIVSELITLLEKPVIFLNDCVGSAVEAAINNSEPGTVFLLENLRFHLEEEGKGLDEVGNKVKASGLLIREFREALRRLADIYVNDTFGVSHKSHSSMLGEGFETKAAGFLFNKELLFFEKVINNPERPFLAILGGSKLADKLQLIQNMLQKVDEMIIAGGMAFSFLKELRGMRIGRSLFDPIGAKLVTNIMEIADRNRVKIHLPVDFLMGSAFSNDALIETTNIEEGIREGWLGLDVGSTTRLNFREPIARAKLILWNGPPGVFEFSNFSGGTHDMLDAVIDATKQGTLTVLCGGDTAGVCNKWDAHDMVSHVSTGGSAGVELLEGKLLPGIEALSDA